MSKLALKTIISKVTVHLNNTRALRYDIVIELAAMGSRFACQLLLIGHYALPLKKKNPRVGWELNFFY